MTMKINYVSMQDMWESQYTADGKKQNIQNKNIMYNIYFYLKARKMIHGVITEESYFSGEVKMGSKFGT